MDAPFARHRMMPDRRDVAPEKEEHMTDVHILAIDLAKRSFPGLRDSAGRGGSIQPDGFARKAQDGSA